MAVAKGYILEVGIHTLLYSQNCLNILHYACIQAPSIQTSEISSQNDLLNRLGPAGLGDIITTMKGCTSSDLIFVNLSAQYVWPTRFLRSDLALGGNGNFGNAAATANVSATIQKQSNLAGKKNRGFIHVPGIGQNQYTVGVLNGAQVTALGAWALKLTAPLLESGGGTGVWEPAILHRKDPIDGTYVSWAQYSVKGTVRVQRRRTVGVGK